MALLYIDAFSGLAGDMLVGALADAGAARETISETLQSFAIGASISFDRVQRRGIAATKFRVTAPELKAGEPPIHRHLTPILKMIHEANLPARAGARAEHVFRTLGEAESAIHGVNIEKVHFHEVGAVDSICDIVATCLALELLHVDRLACSPINVGSGTVETEHGTLPVPAPATAKLLTNKPIYARGPAMELTTPTGAAVVAALAEAFGPPPPMTITSIGYGAGDRDFKEHANVVRVLVGEPTNAAEATNVTVIEANIDDASPQIVAYAIDRLLESGALDALIIPVQMKKGRPGALIQVITTPEKREELISILLRETTTLGVRFHTAERRVEPRQWVEVRTTHGPVRIKTSPEGFAPEYEDARRIAAATGLPLKQILTEATYVYLQGTYTDKQ